MSECGAGDITRTEMAVVMCGQESCAPGHAFGPAVRGCYLIHFVTKGSGELATGNRTWKVHAGQGFMIFPGDVNTYKADSKNPWTYAWIGYGGAAAKAITARAGLTRENPVFDVDHCDEIAAILEGVRADIAALRMGDVSAVGGLYRALARVGQSCPPADGSLAPAPAFAYFQRARWYIGAHLSEGVTVEDAAAFVGLCRSQLYRVFMQTAGVTPRAFIYNARCERVSALLRNPALSMNEIAASAGFASVACMREAYRARTGMSPSETRRTQTHQP